MGFGFEVLTGYLYKSSVYTFEVSPACISRDELILDPLHLGPSINHPLDGFFSLWITTSKDFSNSSNSCIEYPRVDESLCIVSRLASRSNNTSINTMRVRSLSLISINKGMCILLIVQVMGENA